MLRGVYAIVDPSACEGRSVLEVADGILAGGCGALQLRTKHRISDRELLGVARALHERCRRAEVPFVVNDRADIARLCEAEGLHLGQDDLSVADARRIVGEMPIGVSTHDLVQARGAVAAGADLIGFGPVFATATKEDPDPVVGIDGLREVCRAVTVPVVAIGGITIERAGLVRSAGAAMAAAISALCGARDPAAATRAMARAVEGDR